MDPNDLRELIHEEVAALIDWDAWQQCLRDEAEDRETLDILRRWQALRRRP